MEKEIKKNALKWLTLLVLPASLFASELKDVEGDGSKFLNTAWWVWVGLALLVLIVVSRIGVGKKG